MNTPAQNKPAISKKETVISKSAEQLKTLLEKRVEALPKNFNPTRFQQNAMHVIRDTRSIENVDPITIARTILQGAFLGLDFLSKECYAICYGSTLNFQTDYKGEIKLVMKHSVNEVQDIYAKLIRKGDVLENPIVQGRQIINFNPIMLNDEEIVGSFAVCLFKNGSMLYEVMSKKEIEEVRKNYSKNSTGSDSPWVKSPGEMYKKTVLRRLCKLITLDFSEPEQVDAWNAGSNTDFNKPSAQSPQVAKSSLDAEIQGDVIEGKAETVEVKS